MNFSRFSITSAIAMLITLFSYGCSNNSKSEEATNTDKEELTFKFKSFSFNAIGEMPDSLIGENEDSRYIQLSGEGVIPLKIGNYDLTPLYSKLMDAADINIKHKKVAPKPTSGITLTKLDPNSTQTCSYSHINLDITLITNEVIVWRIYRFDYMCMLAHGTYSTSYINYSPIDNKILTLNDIMNSGYETDLRNLLRDRLKENPDVFSPEDADIPETFRITSDGLTFTYPIYDIAPYSAGEIEISLSMFELDGLLNEHGEELIGD